MKGGESFNNKRLPQWFFVTVRELSAKGLPKPISELRLIMRLNKNNFQINSSKIRTESYNRKQEQQGSISVWKTI